MPCRQLGEHAPRVGEHETVVVRRRERAGPGVEQLERPGASGELDVDERHSHRRQEVHQFLPHRRLGVDQRLGVFVGAAWPAFDEVTGDRERRSGERQHRYLGAEFADDAADSVGDVGDVVGLQRPQPAKIVAGAERFAGDGPGPRGDVDAEADGVDGHDDVREQDGRVDAISADRLQGDLRRQVGLFDGVEDRAVAAPGPVLGQTAAGLAHEPHRRAGHRLPPRCSEEDRVGHVVDATDECRGASERAPASERQGAAQAEHGVVGECRDDPLAAAPDNMSRPQFHLSTFEGKV